MRICSGPRRGPYMPATTGHQRPPIGFPCGRAPHTASSSSPGRHQLHPPNPSARTQRRRGRRAAWIPPIQLPLVVNLASTCPPLRHPSVFHSRFFFLGIFCGVFLVVCFRRAWHRRIRGGWCVESTLISRLRLVLVVFVGDSVLIWWALVSRARVLASPWRVLRRLFSRISGREYCCQVSHTRVPFYVFPCVLLCLFDRGGFRSDVGL
jgi:hypothetical protein